MTIRTFGTLLIISVALNPRPAAGQVVRGFVAEQATGTPVPGALVTLVDSAGREYARGITGTSGSFSLAGAPGGTRQVQVARIGFRAWRSQPFTGATSDTVQLRLVVEDLLVQLPELTARAERGCAALEDANDRVVVLWEEARKAISLADLSYQRDPMQYRVDRRNSRIDDDEHLLSDSIRTVNLQARWPVEALPAGALLNEGFVQRDRIGGMVYYGPDLSVLYAPEFLATHCLSAVAGDSGSNLVGVGYRPATEGGPSDVEGAVWLDATTLQLRSLEFRYTGLDRWVPKGSAGGELRFRRMDDGRWVIDRWRMRAPIPRIRGLDTTLFGFAGLEEVVVAVTGPGGVPLWQGEGLARGNALASAGWTGAPRVRGAVAVLGSPIQLDDERIKGSQNRVVTARNRSDRPVRITGLALYSCVNVQARCSADDADLVLPPGEERVILEVRPWMPGRPPRYEIAYLWQLE
jgi:hypothetical protein